ncbi:MAG: hypothetical protein CMG00_06065 [Candidatus Marinimicrobia bacterium]|nr:hypothetical protein [Candidatus Neomarinimicrobiota bacterium]|tara:strand:+ start:1025 stop:1414 length:390 start_codon:yes stop_codon:yes gene_type:complete
MSIFSFISNLFKPAADLVDELHVSDEEKGKLRNQLAEIQAKAQKQMLDYEAKVVEARSKLMVAEAQSPHLITAIWRPVACLSLIALVVLSAYGIGNPDKEVYELTKILLGAYASGRTIEKVVKVSKFGK